MHYTIITLDEMQKTMVTLGFIEATGTPTIREYVYEKIVVENPKIIIKVYTSISKTNNNGRQKGQDAIRICAVNITDRIGWIRTVKVLRVNGWRSNLLNAINRVEKQARNRVQRYLTSHPSRNPSWSDAPDNKFVAKVSVLNVNKNRYPRNICPACGNYFVHKDLVAIQRDEEENDGKIQKWFYKCSGCRSDLIILNE
jgi:hypothetical protein